MTNPCFVGCISGIKLNKYELVASHYIPWGVPSYPTLYPLKTHMISHHLAYTLGGFTPMYVAKILENGGKSTMQFIHVYPIWLVCVEPCPPAQHFLPTG
jgi:hypothetical protein